MTRRHARLLSRCSILVSLMWLVASASASVYWVSPAGKSTGRGTVTDTLDLTTALSAKSPAKPGDTIWLAGGTYKGDFRSDLTGAEGAPIIVRQAANQRAVIDGSILVLGGYAWYWGFEVTNTAPDRTTPLKIGMDVQGHHTKLINLVVHDVLRSGVGFWTPAIDSEIYGCIIYKNGVTGLDHAIYMQNDTGTKMVSDNVMFGQKGLNIHAYGAAGQLKHMAIQGNVSVGCGTLVGGSQPAEDISLVSNYSYNSALALGYHADGNRGLMLSGNVVVNSEIRMWYWDQVTVTRNTVVTNGRILGWKPPTSATPLQNDWGLNTYISPRACPNDFYAGVDYARVTFAQWQQIIGSDASSVFLTKAPTGVTIICRPNRYEPGRGHIIVYNWDKKPSVQVSLRGLMPLGSRYEVRAVQDLYGTPVASGVVSLKPVTIPMAGTDTAPEFGTFLVTRR